MIGYLNFIKYTLFLPVLIAFSIVCIIPTMMYFIVGILTSNKQVCIESLQNIAELWRPFSDTN